MDFDAWSVDLESASATHSSGFRIVIEGNPSDPMGVSPGRFPEGLNALDQVRLLRSGVSAVMKAATSAPARTPVVKAAAAPPKPRVRNSNRPILSLRRP